MAQIPRERTQEYWHSVPSDGIPFPAHGLQTRGDQPSCPLCGTPYTVGARFCQGCGLSRQGGPEKRDPIKRWPILDAMRKRFGLSTASLALLLAAAVFVMATAVTGLIHNASTPIEWQAVQTWRIEWLLATVAALLAAMVFKTKT